jgi:multiple sugar transport system substrate-binding protein
MPSSDDLRHSLSRRRFLTMSALAGTGMALGSVVPMSAARAANVSVRFAGWAFEPQVVELRLNQFMAENPDIKVDYTPLDMQLYSEKMIALFNAGTQPDAFYVRDTDLGAWVDAGWLQPIDGLPKLAELNQDIYPFDRQALVYKGKQYGTPYYGDIYVYLYDRTALDKAGVKSAPVTLDQLKSAALEVKKAGLADYPILKGYKTNVDGLSEFWSMVLASGGHLFTPAMDPVFPNEDKTALTVLEWMLDAMHSWNILDPRGLELDDTQVRDAYLSGQGIFTSNVGNVFPRSNTPQYSKRAGNIRMTRFPGVRDVGKGPMGWARLYGMSSQAKNRDAAWRLMYFLGGKDGKGQYSSAKTWYLRYGVGYPFRQLDSDPQIEALQKQLGYEPAIIHQQMANASTRENIATTWYSEWDRFTQQQIQSVLMRQTTPLAALTASAQKAQQLKKEAS